MPDKKLRLVPDAVHKVIGFPGPIPSLQNVLAIAQLGVERPNSLTAREVRDLSRTMLVHYAQMGID